MVKRKRFAGAPGPLSLTLQTLSESFEAHRDGRNCDPGDRRRPGAKITRLKRKRKPNETTRKVRNFPQRLAHLFFLRDLEARNEVKCKSDCIVGSRRKNRSTRNRIFEALQSKFADTMKFVVGCLDVVSDAAMNVSETNLGPKSSMRC